MALSISIPYPSSGSSVAAGYHNITGILNASKLPDNENGTNLWTMQFMVSSYATQSDRQSGIPPLTSTLWTCPSVAMDSADFPQLYAFLLTQPSFAGATNC